MKRVTGIGGIFFKTKDPELVREWIQSISALQLTNRDLPSNGVFRIMKIPKGLRNGLLLKKQPLILIHPLKHL